MMRLSCLVRPPAPRAGHQRLGNCSCQVPSAEKFQILLCNRVISYSDDWGNRFYNEYFMREEIMPTRANTSHPS